MLCYHPHLKVRLCFFCIRISSKHDSGIEMKITTGNKVVLSSGVVSSFELNPIEFELSENPKMTLKIAVEGDQEELEASISGNVVDNSTMVITVKNPHVTLNFGPASPIPIGHIDGKAMSISFRVDVMGNYNSFALSYTIFVEA